MATETRERADLTPRHGFGGDRLIPPTPTGPLGLTITISRQTGARGGTIARRVGRLLGWAVYDQELLDFLSSQDGVGRDGLPESADRWADLEIDRLRSLGRFRGDEAFDALVLLMLRLAAGGKTILVGRGAGRLLPPAHRLNVRIVAPLPDRIAYFAQWQCMSLAEAGEAVTRRDAQRNQFLANHYYDVPLTENEFDLTLNSSLLGEEICAALIVQAAQSKLARLEAVEPRYFDGD